MREQLIVALLENFAGLHVEYLQTGKGTSLMAYLSKMESEWKGDWKNLAATEARLMMAICKKIAEALGEDDQKENGVTDVQDQ